MIQVIYPPHPFHIKKNHKSVFLAGSIEMGKAVEWQQYIIDETQHKEITLLNPRRLDWNADLELSINNAVFFEQVNWELEGLEVADLIIFYFSPHTKSPVTLLEFGMYARSNKLVVCCPEGYWRKGNVDIVCQRYGVRQVGQLEEIVQLIKDL